MLPPPDGPPPEPPLLPPPDEPPPGASRLHAFEGLVLGFRVLLSCTRNGVFVVPFVCLHAWPVCWCGQWLVCWVAF